MSWFYVPASGPSRASFTVAREGGMGGGPGKGCGMKLMVMIRIHCGSVHQKMKEKIGCVIAFKFVLFFVRESCAAIIERRPTTPIEV